MKMESRLMEADMSTFGDMAVARNQDIEKVKDLLMGQLNPSQIEDNLNAMESYFGAELDGSSLTGDPELKKTLVLWFGTICPDNKGVQMWVMARLLVLKVLVPMREKIREQAQSIRTLTLAIENKNQGVQT